MKFLNDVEIKGDVVTDNIITDIGTIDDKIITIMETIGDVNTLLDNINGEVV